MVAWALWSIPVLGEGGEKECRLHDILSIPVEWGLWFALTCFGETGFKSEIALQLRSIQIISLAPSHISPLMALWCEHWWWFQTFQNFLVLGLCSLFSWLCKCSFFYLETDVTNFCTNLTNKWWPPLCYREPLAVLHTAFPSGFVKCCQHVGFLWPSQSGFSVDCWEAGLLKEWAKDNRWSWDLWIFTLIYISWSDCQIGFFFLSFF